MARASVLIVIGVLGGLLFHVDGSAQCPVAWDSEDHLVVLGADSNRLYVGRSNGDLPWQEALHGPWALWSAPRLGGDLVPENLVPFQAPAWDKLGTIQHVSIHPSRPMAVMSAHRTPEAADLDLFMAYRMDQGEWSFPMPLDGLNSTKDEVFPRWEGRDLAFSTGRSGQFERHLSLAATQYLRSQPLEPSECQDGRQALSDVKTGLETMWATEVPADGEPLRIVEWAVPVATNSLPEGWTLCLEVDGKRWPSPVMSVRDMSTRHLVAKLRGEEGSCASLQGLPQDRPWSVRWLREESGAGSVWNEAALVEAVVVAPSGQEFRRIRLSSVQGWAFVFLPLDPIRGLARQRIRDASDWPNVEVAVVHFDHASAHAQQASWDGFKAWAKATSNRNTEGMSAGRWVVTGHTDASGSQAKNDALSAKRARTVEHWLTEELGWPQDLLEVRAKGSSEPLGPDPALNRRVEVRWVPSML